MAYLNGNHVPNLLRLRTLITKFVGTCCSVSAGLPMGPEGPMVHIGACLASVITYAECSEWLICQLLRAMHSKQCLQDGAVLDGSNLFPQVTVVTYSCSSLQDQCSLWYLCHWL